MKVDCNIDSNDLTVEISTVALPGIMNQGMYFKYWRRRHEG